MAATLEDLSRELDKLGVAIDKSNAEKAVFRAVCEWILEPDRPIGSNAEFSLEVRRRAAAAIAHARGEQVGT
jgi:hypothetical protein